VRIAFSSPGHSYTGIALYWFFVQHHLHRISFSGLGFLGLLLFAWLATPWACFAQAPDGVFRKAPNRNCRLDENALGPLIDPDNPFFYGHYFDERTKTEIARLSPERRLKINQAACQHHQVTLRLTVDRSIADPEDLNSYTIELFNLMNRLHWGDPEYDTYREEFETKFIQAYRRNGLTKLFNFPLADRTFICLLDHVQGDITIKVDIVKYVVDGIVTPGIERYKDDGYFGTRTDQRR